MKRYLVLSSLVFFLMGTFPAFSRAEVPQPDKKQESSGSAKSDQTSEQAGKYGLGLALGIRSTYFRLEQARRKIVGNLSQLDEDQNYLPQNPMIQVGLSKNFALELGYNKFKAVARNRVPEGVSDGNIEWTPIMLALQFRWPSWHKSFVPYVSGGVSYSKVDFNILNWYYYGFPSSEAYEDWVGHGKRVEDYPNDGYRRVHSAEDCYGAFLGLGLDYFILKHWAINLDGRYHWAQSNWSYYTRNNQGASGVERGTANLDSWIIGLGLKFFF